MSFEHDNALESNVTQSPRKIFEISNKIEENDNMDSESLSKGVDNDSKSILSLSKGIIGEDHGNELSDGGYDERTQETRKLATTVSDGVGVVTSESLDDFANKIRRFRSRSAVTDLDKKLPFGTSQGDNSGNSKWPTVSTDRIKHSRSRSNVTEVFDPNKVVIDTKAPIDSVKAAVSKFGRIHDWKATKVQTVERTKVIDEEIEKVQEEIPLYKEQAEIAEKSKVQMLKELENTKRLIEELKTRLERAQTEESQAQQDSQLAKLRLEELATGVGHEASMVTKTELEMAKNRHRAAITDLKFVKKELESLKKEHELVLIEKDAVVEKAEEAVSDSKEMEKTVEMLTVELVSTKEALETANLAHKESEEHRIGALMAKEQDLYTWDKELKETQECLVHLNQQIDSAKEMKAKLSIALSRIEDMKAELAAYMDPNMSGEGEKTLKAAILGVNNELDDVKRRLGKANDEVNCLKLASTSLKAELEKEQSELVHLRQREGMASIAIASLESELEKLNLEIEVVQRREKEARDKMEELPRQLQQASEEMEAAKSEAELAQREMNTAREEGELAKARAKLIQSRLFAAQKEIEAIRASERLALTAIRMLHEKEFISKTNGDDPDDGVTLTLEEYYEMGKRAHEAEEEANAKVNEAISRVEKAKEEELKSMKQLEDTILEVDERKEALHIAQDKAEKAREGKLRVENELRKMRFERRNAEAGQSQSQSQGQTTDGAGPTHEPSSPRENDETSPKEGVFGHPNATKKKKKSVFPKFFMFLGKKHWKSSSKS